MFSGTTFIQEKRGNRPIRITNTLLESGIPVVFSYYRWNKSEEIPRCSDKHLFQLPIDYTMGEIDNIIEKDIQVKNKIFIMSFPYPEMARYINVLRLNGWKVIYDVRDDWEEFQKVNMAKWYSESVERYFVCNCDLVCCVAKPLQEKMQQYTKDKHILLSPNAYDTNFLNDTYLKKAKVKDTTIVGYFGHLSNGWFDWENLIKIASMDETINYEIIGHFEPKGLILPKNIKLLGSKSHNEINEISSSWSAAIIPFVMNKLSAGVDPIKVYEYLALKLPVISFVMPQIHDYPNVYIADSNDSFVLRIKEALGIEFEEEKASRFLQENTWEIRTQEMLNWCEAIEVDMIMTEVKE
jgi:hypothetical protein